VKQSIWFILGLSIAGGTMALAAPGDLIYQYQVPQQAITAQQAACFADCAIAAGTWDGARADMVKTCASRDGNGGFHGFTVGLGTIAPGDIPASSGAYNVVGRVE